MRNTEIVNKSHNRSDVLKTLNLYNSSKKAELKKWQPEYSTFDAFSNSAAYIFLWIFSKVALFA